MMIDLKFIKKKTIFSSSKYWKEQELRSKKEKSNHFKFLKDGEIYRLVYWMILSLYFFKPQLFSHGINFQLRVKNTK